MKRCILGQVFFAILLCFSVWGGGVQAEEAVPEMPAPIQNLVAEGAQVRFLGKDYGLEAWLTIKNGVEQYFYVMPDHKAFVMGVLFDKKGKVVTVDQVSRLQAQGDTVLDSLTEFPTHENATKNKAFEFKTPAEQLFSDVEASNWVPLGKAEAPVMYSFIDPQCPHCHEFISRLRREGYLEKGQIQLRLIPVGFKDETRAQAAFLMAAPDPEQRWFRHMDGDKTALPAKAEINQQGVQRNLAIMQSWKFDVTPMMIYRDKTNAVKLVRGVPQDMKAVLDDMGAKGG